MADAQYDDLIVGGLLGGPRERHALARKELPAALLVGAHRTVYELALRYFQVTGEPVDWPAFSSMAEGLEPARRLMAEQEFARLWHMEVPEAHFRWALHSIRERRRDERFAAGLIEALRAMTEGVRGEQGYDASRRFLSEALADVDRHFQGRTPEGNIRLEGAEVARAYDEAKRTEGLEPRMVRTGLREVDATILGLRPGENMLVAGYSGHGKTTVIQNIAWHACVLEAKNVLIFTNENLYEQYRARIYNRHAHHLPGRVGTEGGLPMMDIRAGALSGQDEAVWRRVCADLGSNEGYGVLQVVQMPTAASMAWVVDQLGRYSEEFDVGLVVLDYIGRLGPISPRPTRREELNDSINLWKSALVGFDGGRGVPGITGYQISREHMERAALQGYYTLNCLAETSEAERNADVVATALRQEDVERELRMQVPKNRDGPTLEPFSVVADFATTLVASMDGWAR